MPNSDQMEGMSRDLRYYWARFDQLLIEDGILGIRVPLGDGPTTQFRTIVPHASRQEIIELAHGSAAGGHFGIQKLLINLNSAFTGHRCHGMFRIGAKNAQLAITKVLKGITAR